MGQCFHQAAGLCSRLTHLLNIHTGFGHVGCSVMRSCNYYIILYNVFKYIICGEWRGSGMSHSANVQPFFDAMTETWSYVVFDQQGGHAAVIDPVLDFDYAAG